MLSSCCHLLAARAHRNGVSQVDGTRWFRTLSISMIFHMVGHYFKREKERKRVGFSSIRLLFCSRKLRPRIEKLCDFPLRIEKELSPRLVIRGDLALRYTIPHTERERDRQTSCQTTMYAGRDFLPQHL